MIQRFESWLKAMHALGEARGKHPRCGGPRFAEIRRDLAEIQPRRCWPQETVDTEEARLELRSSLARPPLPMEIRGSSFPRPPRRKARDTHTP